MRRVLAVVTVVAALVAPTAVASAHAATVPLSAAAAAASRTAPPTLQFGDKGLAVQILQHALRVPKVHAQGFFNRSVQSRHFNCAWGFGPLVSSTLLLGRPWGLGCRVRRPVP